MARAVAQDRPAASAVPLEPVAAILEAFQTHSVVALSEGPHGNEQGHALRLALIRHPRFAATVNDIVVESGNARYQEMMDRFVAGDDVSVDELQVAWQDTTQVTPVWDRPIYEELFRAVRAVNSSVSREHRIRVLLGDPPVDWPKVLTGSQDFRPLILGRDRHAAEVIEREVLAKKRRALVIYGDAHLFRAGESVVGILERNTSTKTLNIVTASSGANFNLLTAVQPEVRSWPVPSLAAIRGTALDTQQFKYYDAVLYLGPPSALSFSKLSPATCEDAAYLKMRSARMAFMRPPGTVSAEQELSRECSR